MMFDDTPVVLRLNYEAHSPTPSSKSIKPIYSLLTAFLLLLSLVTL